MLGEEERIDVRGIPTDVYRVGTSSSSSSKTVVVIPGNPGVSAFYIPFADQLFRLGGETIDVLVISHAGHSPPDKHRFTLDEQLTHKLAVIDQLISRDEEHRLILIGHSIGAFLLLRMLDSLSPRFDRAFLLFPTLEHMAQSDAGQHFQRWYFLSRLVVPLLSRVLPYLLPCRWLQVKLVSFYLSDCPVNDRTILVNAVLDRLLHPLTLNNVLGMANEEMSVVQEREHRFIERHLPKLTFYYGERDHWVADDIPRRLKSIYPHGDIVLCAHQYLHAFVLKHSKQLANFVFSRLI